MLYTKRHDYYGNKVYHPYAMPNYPVSIVSFRADYLLFDINGAVINPDGALLEGYWGEKRLGDSLPVDYETDEKEKAVDVVGGQ